MKKIACIVAGMFLSMGVLADVQDVPGGSGHDIRAFQVVGNKVFFVDGYGNLKLLQMEIQMHGSSCKAIKEGNPLVTSGVYSIDPDGAGPIDPLEVFCDMETDGGGWTLVARMPMYGNAVNNTMTTDSNFETCLTDRSASCSELSWQHRDIYGTQYLIEFEDQQTLLAQLVVQFPSARSWFAMRHATVNDIDFSYSPDDPATHFKGYGGDCSSRGGCQDSAIVKYYVWRIGDGNSPCAGNFFLFGTTDNGRGAYYGTNWHKKAFLYVR
uniref:Fibrinogen beta and gamma chains, C-terminal globular domain n=1 Tax=Candidatus Kentrum sp. MB TaxID=2138164 RepID=A0A451B954_9GAMM|nr:MAG: Fibrinogen beta and gamma chains, C-terminal globular domain [Candidatus Kentron sp. MB]VFK29539.1 MAG: Fibrinogen beta and gamma chains, C-terminal globular domain [Candidatus Kentron sp. MB]VFK74820.1 MAG: Fibrinogen beta and gamma chains, C-terminal globular domain [Candidatus Kentron sp. MB]